MANLEDVATNAHIQAIADGIRSITRTTEDMTIPEMPERLLAIKVVEVRNVSPNFSAHGPVSLGRYQTMIKHLFIVSPQTNDDALLLSRVAPEIKLIYDEATGDLLLDYLVQKNVTIDLVVADYLLPEDTNTQGFLIGQGDSSSYREYDETRRYERGESFLYNKGTESVPDWALAITTVDHDGEEFNPEHNILQATQFLIEGEQVRYTDLHDLAFMLDAHVSDKNNPHEVTKAQVGLGNVDNTSDENKPISTAQQRAFETKVDKEEGKALSTNDFSNSYKQQVESNTASRHTHANKSVLDQIEQPFTSTQKQKLDGIEQGAQVNVIETIKRNGVVQEVNGKTVDFDVPEKTSELQNDSNFANQEYVNSQVSSGISTHNQANTAHNDIRILVSTAQATADEAKSIAEGRQKAISSINIQSMVQDLLQLEKTALNEGDNIYLLETGVPDLWVYKVTDNFVQFQYTTDEAFINYLHTIGYVQVGYFQLAELETEKVDLSDYVQKTRKINNKALDQDINLTSSDVGADPAGTASSAVSAHDASASAHSELFGAKVDKVPGKALSSNDFTDDYKGQVEANTTARHTHSNKATLDSITAAFTTEEKTKLGNVVLFTEQSLETAQKAQARANIGASDFDGSYNSLANKPILNANLSSTDPTTVKVNQLYRHTGATAGDLIQSLLYVSNGSAWKRYAPVDYVDLTSNQSVDGVKTFVKSPKLSTNTLTTSSGNTITFANESATMASTNTAQTVSGKKTFTGGVQMNSNVTADTTNSRDIGTSSVQFRNIYGQNVYQNGSKVATDSAVVHIAGEETITGSKTFNADVNIGTASQKRTLYVYGDIIQNGTPYETHAEHLYVKDSIVHTRDGATTGLGSGYSGIIATKYDGTNDGGILFDANGIARVGDVSYDSSGNPLADAMQPLATREETPSSYGVPYWDSTLLRFTTLTPGTSGKVLTSKGSGATPAWEAPIKKTTSSVLTLTASGWDSNNQQKVSTTVNTANLNTIVPQLGTNGANSLAWANCGINAIKEESTGITFSCSIKPTTNLTFYIVTEVLG